MSGLLIRKCGTRRSSSDEPGRSVYAVHMNAVLDPAYRILVADDHPLIRAGLVAMLAGHPDFDVAVEARNGAEALALWESQRPDVGLIDLRMPVLDGFETLRAIRAKDPRAKLVAVTTLDGDEDVYQAIQAGASGYLLKDCEQEELLTCLRNVRAGQKYVQMDAACKLAARVTMTTLTQRERDVLKVLASGLSNKSIARQLDIGEGTVKFHVKALLEKLDASTRTEAVRIALQRGLLRLGD